MEFTQSCDQFQSFVYTGDFDIVCVTETWLTDAVSNAELLPNSYSVFRRDRVSRGGGVLIAIKNSISSQLFCIGDTTEMISVHLDTCPRSLLTCLYIPPNCSDVCQREILNSLNCLGNDPNSFIVGDLNLSDIEWETQHAKSLFSQNVVTLSVCIILYNWLIFQLIVQGLYLILLLPMSRIGLLMLLFPLIVL